MSGLISTAGLISTKLVGLTKHTKHAHVPSPIAPNFVAPSACVSLLFRPTALAAAIARTATTWDGAPKELLNGLQQSALIELATLVEDGSTFELKSYFNFLADTAGSQFAAKVGAGIAHLYMETLGYEWRANAVCVSSSLNPHADFIYDGGNAVGHGVVLAEAHGSFAKNVTAGTITSAAKRKYKKQVKPYVATPSPFGKIIHGYSIAFGSKPTATSSFLSVSETRISKPKKKSDDTPLTVQAARRREATSTPIVLATHRSNFILMGAPEVVDWIDWIQTVERSPPALEPVPFLQLQHDSRHYLASALWIGRFATSPSWIEELLDYRYMWHALKRKKLSGSLWTDADFGWFAMDEKGATEFLNGLSTAINGGEPRIPSSFVLPTFDPVGFGFGDGDRSVPDFREDGDRAYNYARFRDGLALLGDPFRGQPRDIVWWHPYDGLLLG